MQVFVSACTPVDLRWICLAAKESEDTDSALEAMCERIREATSLNSWGGPLVRSCESILVQGWAHCDHCCPVSWIKMKKVGATKKRSKCHRCCGHAIANA